ncbi:MAG: sensory box histidine kinase/response regulator protein, partial [Desulfobulbus sp.]
EEDASISPVRNQDGEIINYVAVKRDVTQEVALKKQLNQAMKMEAIGTMAGGIAHDFNNILSAVLGYAEMAELQLAEDDPARKDVGQIIVAAHRASDLIRQILTFSRQEEKELRSVKIQFVIKEALKLLRSSLPTSIDLQQDIDPDCGPVLADPVRIHQVLMNLCTNAKQAMAGEQGRLIVRLSALVADSSIGSSFLEQGHWLDLEVSDTGVGMDPQVRERIFDPFFTTKKKGQGTGLGLSVVHGIIKSHGGEITVDSEPGRGTTFHVYLPMVDSEENHEEEAQQIILPRGDEHILLVDDEPLLVEIIERSLSILGYRVTSFTDSRQALKWFRRHGDRVDLVVTDMTMPHLTGADLAREILTAKPQLPIILCTGYSEVMDADRARAMGIRKFLAKPVETRTLAQSVRDVLDT